MFNLKEHDNKVEDVEVEDDNAPSEFNNISIKHDMTPDERTKEKELYLKAKDVNNDSSNL